VIQAPLPDGWMAQASRDRLQAGPPGHWILQVERKPDAGDRLPSIEQLTGEFIQDFPRGMVSTQIEKSSGEFSILVFVLSGRTDDGGLKSTAGMLGAKQIRPDLYLCSTEPGQTLADAQRAASACEGLWIESS
jgi:hypothetical protein